MMKMNDILFGALALALGAVNLSVSGADWPQYRGSNHDGIVSEPMAKTWPANGPKQVWLTPLTDGFSSFTIAQGRAVTLVKRTLDGADQEVCVALDAQTGKELWATPIDKAKYDSGGDSGAADNRGGDGPRSTPTLDGDHVYTLSGYLSLACLDARTGQVQWTNNLVKTFGGKVIPWQSAESPVLEGDLIFLNINAPDQPLVALHKLDGTLAWKSGAKGDGMTQASPIVATILGVRQVIFFAQSGLVAVKAQDGQVLWRYAFPYNVSTAASPVVAGDMVYCSAGYDVGGGAVQLSKTGDDFTVKQLWRTPKKVVSHWSTPVYLDGHLYGLFGFKEFGKGPLKCLELATGNEVWSQPGFGPGGVLLVDGRLLILGDKGQVILAAASPKGYTELARAQVEIGKCWNVPAFSNGHLFARGTKAGVCLDLSPKD